MRILITGANGQLGRVLQPTLHDHELVPLAHAQLDITQLADVQTCLAAHRPEFVINAAAYTNVDAAESDKQTAYRVNALAARNLALATAASEIPLLHISTDYVFDGTGQEPLHEFAATNPQSVYGHSKLQGERLIAQFNPRHFIVRTAWLYANEGRNFALTMLAQAARTDIQEVRVVNDQFGSPTYAPHLAQAIARLSETQAYGVYHCAGHCDEKSGTSWYALTCELYRVCGITMPVTPVNSAQFPRPAPRPAYSVLTTWQDPQFVLPNWQAGVAEFARHWQAAKTSTNVATD